MSHYSRQTDRRRDNSRDRRDNRDSYRRRDDDRCDTYSRERRDYRDSRDNRDTYRRRDDSRERRDYRDNRDNRDSRDSRDTYRRRDDSRDRRDSRDSRDTYRRRDDSRDRRDSHDDLPRSEPSICIPRIFSNITKQRIINTFADLGLGEVASVDLLERTNQDGDKYLRAYVHFKRWYSNKDASATRKRLLDGKDAKIVYDEPWFWKISASRWNDKSDSSRHERAHSPRRSPSPRRRSEDREEGEVEEEQPQKIAVNYDAIKIPKRTTPLFTPVATDKPSATDKPLKPSAKAEMEKDLYTFDADDELYGDILNIEGK